MITNDKVAEKIWTEIEQRLGFKVDRSTIGEPDLPVTGCKLSSKAYQVYNGVKFFCNPRTDFWSVAQDTKDPRDFKLWVTFIGFHYAPHTIELCWQALQIIKDVVNSTKRK